MRLSLLLLVSCALPLSACSQIPKNNAEEPPQAVVDPIPVGSTPTPCRPEAVEGLVGKVADAATVEKAVKDSGAKHARVVKPNMAVTMDFREDRLTIHVDAQNRIERIGCN